MRTVRCGALALLLALAGSVAACGEDDPTGADVRGSIRITVNKTGAGTDPDGFLVSLDGATPVSVAAGQSTVFENVPTGTHTVALSGMAANCTAASGVTSWTLSVPGAREMSAVFVVNCS